MPEADSTRRRFLSYLAELVLLAICLLMVIPALGYLFAPLRRRSNGDGSESAFCDAGLLSDIPVGQWHLLTLEVLQQDGWKKTRMRHAVWVRRGGEGDRDITIKSPICSHLGCPVNWHTDRKEFMCPCHGGVFDADGKRVAGPPPRDMDSLEEFKVLNGRLWVRWQDFKIGVAGRVPVSV